MGIRIRHALHFTIPEVKMKCSMWNKKADGSTWNICRIPSARLHAGQLEQMLKLQS